MTLRQIRIEFNGLLTGILRLTEKCLIFFEREVAEQIGFSKACTGQAELVVQNHGVGELLNRTWDALKVARSQISHAFDIRFISARIDGTVERQRRLLSRA